MKMEIKLRAWHEESKEMIYFNNEKWSSDKFQCAHIAALMNGIHPSGELSFSLGQIDSSGTYIYTGDKCEITKTVWPNGLTYTIEVVVSEPDFSELGGGYSSGQDWSESVDSIYVVGNQWEGEN